MLTGQIAVAGHICLDIIPAFPSVPTAGTTVLVPGALINVGPAHLATGGPVANVGLALHRLGVEPQLIGKVGADRFGQTVLDLLREAHPRLADAMVVAADAVTSYSVVISPPEMDRIFLHCPGANQSFGATDMEQVALASTRLVHFGYPPLMQRMYQQDGAEMAAIFLALKHHGVTTSLDMSLPDPTDAAAAIDWSRWLRRVLPTVDFFLPSSDELAMMLGLPEPPGSPTMLALDAVAAMAAQCLTWGAAIVAIKLGDQGLYLRTTPDIQRLQALGKGTPAQLDAWRGRELYLPCFMAQVVGTTGAGDATIAGLLTACLLDLLPEAAMQMAVAVGACSVEAVDANSGVPSWEAVQHRIAAGWRHQPVAFQPTQWRHDVTTALWFGPNDQKGHA